MLHQPRIVPQQARGPAGECRASEFEPNFPKTFPGSVLAVKLDGKFSLTVCGELMPRRENKKLFPKSLPPRLA
jgi:hypothetical protein